MKCRGRGSVYDKKGWVMPKVKGSAPAKVSYDAPVGSSAISAREKESRDMFYVEGGGYAENEKTPSALKREALVRSKQNVLSRSRTGHRLLDSARGKKVIRSRELKKKRVSRIPQALKKTKGISASLRLRKGSSLGRR